MSVDRLVCSTRTLLGLGLLLGLVACAAPEAAVGLEGHLRLAYVDSVTGCARDCAADIPMAEGSRALVEVVDYDAALELEAVSRDPAILAIAPSYRAGLFMMTAGAAGDVVVDFVQPDGRTYDSFALHVREVVAIERLEESPVVATAEPSTIENRLRGPSGEVLRGLGGVEYDASPNLTHHAATVFDVAETLMASGVAPRFERVSLVGDLSGGAGELRVTARAGASLVIPVDVVAPDVRGVLLAVSSGDPLRVTATIDVANEGPGVFACCEWTFEPTTAPIRSVTRDCSWVEFSRSSEGTTVDVTCEVRGHRATVPVPL